MSTHTVTTTKSWSQRLGNSLGGIVFGIVLVIAGTILLWWNEGNYVFTKVSLNEAQSVTVALESISTVDRSKEGMMVYAAGTAETDDILEDTVFGISTNAMNLERTVQFYQWVESSSTTTETRLGGEQVEVTTYSYERKWVNSPVNSSNFYDARGHSNRVLLNLENLTVNARNVAFGAYRLPDFFIARIRSLDNLRIELTDEVRTKLDELNIRLNDFGGTPTTQNNLDDIPVSLLAPVSALATPSQVVAQEMSEDLHSPEEVTLEATTTESTPLLPFDNLDAPVTVSQHVLPNMVHVEGNTIYLGRNPNNPQIGDIRVTFQRTLPSKAVSLIAKQIGDTFEAFTAANNYTVALLELGTVSAENMYASAHAANEMMTWLLRFGGIFLVFIGLRMVFAPLEVLASVVPFLGKLVGAGIGFVSMVLGLAWSLLIIALAWLFYRPLIGIIILVVVVGLVALLFSKRSSGKTDQPELAA